MIRQESSEPRPAAGADGRIRPKAGVRWDPVISADEERELAGRIRGGDEAARRQLIVANLRVVVEIARGFRTSKLALDDLIQEGNLGLIRASADFDPAVHDCRFYTYAEVWIRAYIHRALINNDSLIRVPQYVFLRRRQDQRLAPTTPGPDPAAAASRAAEPTFATEGDIGPLAEAIIDEHRPDQQAAEQEQHLLLEIALRRLSPVEAWVIRERYGLLLPIPEEREWSARGPGGARRDDPRDEDDAEAEEPGQGRAQFHRTYIDLARACGLSRHRILQVEQSALAKLRGALRPCLA